MAELLFQFRLQQSHCSRYITQFWIIGSSEGEMKIKDFLPNPMHQESISYWFFKVSSIVLEQMHTTGKFDLDFI
jgi:hypothetical protein